MDPTCKSRLVRAFTLMEVLVVVAIILIIAAIAFPVTRSVMMRSHKATALNNMKQLTTAAMNYAAANDGTLPDEDAKGQDTWQSAAKPENQKAWYNALPKLLGTKTVGEYLANPRDYYRKENILFLPGATYPEEDKRLRDPLFAIAINTKLQRKNEDGNKEPLKLAHLGSKTVLFLEQGLPGETKSHGGQAKYDGSCKGSAKSFVARYGGEGILTFADGHALSVKPKDLLTETGDFPFPPEGIVWTRTPEEDPNKAN